MLAAPTVAILRALLDRLIPADEDVGALAAGVDWYVLGQLEGDGRREAPALVTGLAQVDREAVARHRASFVALPAPEQDALLRDLEAGRAVTTWPQEISAAAFLQRFVDLAHEGFYADPGNGGNAQAASWRMIGYDPHLPSEAAPQSGLDLQKP